MAERFDIFGVPIDVVGQEDVVGQIIDVARNRRFFQVATVNVDFMVNSRHDREVHTILNCSDLNLPDGAPVVWAGRLLGHRAVRRLAGADLVPALVGAAAREKLSVFFLGGEGDAAADAAERLSRRYSGLSVSAYEPPIASLEDIDDDQVLGRIEAARPHILFVALGHPKQDKWIYRNRESLPMVAMGVGCTFDLIAERRSRAPVWMQRVGLEWSYRLAREPRRLARRYATDGMWVAGQLVPWLMAQKLRNA